MFKALKCLAICSLICLLNLGVAQELKPPINKACGYLYTKDINNQELRFTPDGSSIYYEDLRITRNATRDVAFPATLTVDYTGRHWTAPQTELGQMEWGLFNHLPAHPSLGDLHLFSTAGLKFYQNRTRVGLAWSQSNTTNAPLDEYQLLVKNPANNWQLSDVLYSLEQNRDFFLPEEQGQYYFRVRSLDKYGNLVESNTVGPIIFIDDAALTRYNFVFPQLKNNLAVSYPSIVSQQVVVSYNNFYFPGNPTINLVSDVFSVSLTSSGNVLITGNYNYQNLYELTYSGNQLPILVQYEPVTHKWLTREDAVTKKDPLNKTIYFQAKSGEVRNFALAVKPDQQPPTINVLYEGANILTAYPVFPDLRLAVSDNVGLKNIYLKIIDQNNQTVYSFNPPGVLTSNYQTLLKINLPAGSALDGVKNRYAVEILAEDQYANQSIYYSPYFETVIPTSSSVAPATLPIFSIPSFSLANPGEIPALNFYEKLSSNIYKYVVPTGNLSLPVAEFTINFTRVNGLIPQLVVVPFNSHNWQKEHYAVTIETSQDNSITFKTAVPGYYAIIENIDTTPPTVDLYFNNSVLVKSLYDGGLPAISGLISDNVGITSYGLKIIENSSRQVIFAAKELVSNPDLAIYPSDLKRTALIEAKPLNNSTPVNRIANFSNLAIVKSLDYGINAGEYFVQAYATDIGGHSVTVNSPVFKVASAAGVNDFTYGPNPFDAGKEHFKFSLGLSDDSQVLINIYTLSGEKIWSHEGNYSGNALISWDGYNRYGELVANGIYHCFMVIKNRSTNKSEKRKFTIAVLK